MCWKKCRFYNLPRAVQFTAVQFTYAVPRPGNILLTFPTIVENVNTFVPVFLSCFRPIGLIDIKRGGDEDDIGPVQKPHILQTRRYFRLRPVFPSSK